MLFSQDTEVLLDLGIVEGLFCIMGEADPMVMVMVMVIVMVMVMVMVTVTVYIGI